MTQSKSDNWVRIFQVGDPKKHKDGFTIYKVTSVVFPKSAPEAVTNIVVWKRYNDFKVLHNNLKTHHKNCKIAEDLPKLSLAKYFRRFENEIIQERTKCILELLNFIGKHPPLFTCAPFIQFFNSSYQISDTVNESEPNLVNDNGNVTDPSDELLDIGFTEKSDMIGEFKKDVDLEVKPVDCDNSSINSGSSEDERDVVSEGSGCFCSDRRFGKKREVKSSLDNMRYQIGGREKLEPKLENNNYRRGFDDTLIETRKSNLEQEVDIDMAKSLTCLPDHFDSVVEMVSCHTEKPIKDNEMWVYVHSQDFRSRSHSLLPSGLICEEVTPPTDALLASEDYLVEAAYQIGQAQKYEVGGEYESAFALYKSAVACLLNGLSEDECKERRGVVQEKIKRYAERAENVYTMHLSKKRDESEEIPSCTEGLKAYKVVSVIEKVLLVLNVVENKKYVIKVLKKSPCPVDLKKKTIIPYNVPYMVKLIKYFENENSIFLVLEYAYGGKLWDYVDRCFRSYENSEPVANHNSDSDCVECEPEEVSGVSENGTEVSKSYFEMFKDYTAHTARKVFSYYDNGKEVCELSVGREANGNAPNPTDDLDVSFLVENSQKLLESIKNTLQNSDFATDNLTKDINNIETVIDLTESEEPSRSDDRNLKRKSKGRSKSVARSRFEREVSSEDVSESKSRTASNSLDRSGQCSRLAAMLESAPTLTETKIRDWAAEMFVALETLHRWGITCRDLHPGNVLLDDKGHLLLTFQLYWRGVDASISEEAVTGLYAAPETTKIFPVTSSADWWSFGALLFELLTGKPLSSCYPGGIFSHTILTFPDFLSPEACSLLIELLRYEPSERLGGGVNGPDDIKCHPFFNSVDWQLVYDNQ